MRKLLLLSLLLPLSSPAATIAVASSDTLTITLTDEDCKLTEFVTNLPKRAIWNEGGKKVEGCWGVMQATGMINFYFADKTATSLPTQVFTRVTDS